MVLVLPMVRGFLNSNRVLNLFDEVTTVVKTGTLTTWVGRRNNSMMTQGHERDVIFGSENNGSWNFSWIFCRRSTKSLGFWWWQMKIRKCVLKKWVFFVRYSNLGRWATGRSPKGDYGWERSKGLGDQMRNEGFRFGHFHILIKKWHGMLVAVFWVVIIFFIILIIF